MGNFNLSRRERGKKVILDHLRYEKIMISEVFLSEEIFRLVLKNGLVVVCNLDTLHFQLLNGDKKLIEDDFGVVTAISTAIKENSK